MQALDARTPATAVPQPGGLSRVAAALATTVQRPQGGRQPRYSFAGAGAGGLFDLDRCAFLGAALCSCVSPFAFLLRLTRDQQLYFPFLCQYF